jgi:hypothetical protein
VVGAKTTKRTVSSPAAAGCCRDVGVALAGGKRVGNVRVAAAAARLIAVRNSDAGAGLSKPEGFCTMSHSAAETAMSILLQPLPLIMMALMFYMLFMVIRAATARDGSNLGGVTPDGGKVISVKATFAGVRGMPGLFAVASSNANPLFAIRSAGLEYPIIRKHRRAFAEIEQVDVRTLFEARS